MKYITKFLLMGIVAVAGLLSACTSSDDFEPGPKDSGAQVYFPNTIPSEFNVGDDESSVTIPVRRVVTDEALTVNILASIEQGQEGILNIPSSVSFEAGSDLANLVITFDCSALVDGTEYKASLLLNDEQNLTQYGNNMIDITIIPWPWEELGTGKYRDGWLGGFFGEKDVEIDVTIHKHKSQEGVYMVEEMFGWTFMTEFFGATQSDLSGQFSYTPANIVINCANPQAVTIAEQFSGITENGYGYGNFYIMNDPEQVGTLENGVISFPKKGIIVGCDGTSEDAGYYYSNNSGLFRIMLPGAQITDYTLTAAYGGMLVNSDNTSASAVIDFTYGADVTGINYVIAEGDVEASAATLAAQIANGTAENILSVEEFTAGAGSVSVKADLANPGLYTVVALPLDNANKPLEKNVAAVSFYFPGMGGSEIPDCDIQAMMGLVSEYSPEDLAEYPDATSLYFEIKGSELKSLKIVLAATSDVNALLEQGTTYDQMVESGGEDYSTLVPKINQDGGISNIWTGLSEKTSYTMIVKASNTYGKSAVVTAECATAAPDYSGYTGDLVIGDYLMTFDAATQDGGTVTLKNNMTLSPRSTNGTDFFVKNFGLEIGVSWYAQYSESTNEVTMSGEWKYNEGKNFLGGFVGTGGGEAYLFFSVADMNNQDANGKDPIVINVDPSTKQMASLKTYLEVYVGTVEGSSVTDYYLAAIYEPGAKIELVTSAMPSSAVLPSAMIDRMLVSPVQVRFPLAAKGIMQAKVNPVLVNAAANYGSIVRTLDVKTAKCEPLPAKPYNGKAKISKKAVNSPLM